MTDLVWTKTPPTDGYYWHRYSKKETPVIWWIMPGQDISMYNGEWAGPIPEPQEPQGEGK